LLLRAATEDEQAKRAPVAAAGLVAAAA
jgi:hypothetical protein